MEGEEDVQGWIEISIPLGAIISFKSQPFHIIKRISIPLGAIISSNVSITSDLLTDFNSSWCDYKLRANKQHECAKAISIPLGAIISRQSVENAV